MNITDVAWIRDHRGRPVLELRLDGHAVHIHTSQKTELMLLLFVKCWQGAWSTE